MKIYFFLQKIIKKVLNFCWLSFNFIRILPTFDRYNHKFKLEEAICHDVNKVIMKLEKDINAEKK